ncbi:MAG: CHC2 zinc finger domain-containing protein [Nibricoccus sp.]
MPAIKPTCVRDLKFRVNIVDVVSRVATLRKAGARFKGLCPFHQEKTPSFHVDPEKGFYKCFGCGKAGDIITFVRETEQLLVHRSGGSARTTLRRTDRIRGRQRAFARGPIVAARNY